MDAVITLADLDGEVGFTIVGPGQQTGWGIAGAGDVNGDGKRDLLISSDGDEAYVLYGGGTFGVNFDLANIDGTNGFRFITSSGTAGKAVTSLDINGDGFSDVVIGKHVVLGSATLPAVVSGAALGDNGFLLPFTPTSVSGLGDFDGDGIDDLALSIVQSETAWVHLSGSDLIAVPAPGPGMSFAQDVETAGDFNGDGLADFIVSANLAEMAKGHAAGAAYVIFGTNSPPPTVDVTELDGTNGFRIDAAETAGRLSWSMGRAGDVNGDGFDDIIVQATDADPGVWREGTTYILFGRAGGLPPTFDLENIDGINGVRIDNIEYRGQAMSAATGDFNGDGYADVAIGAPGRTPLGEEYGPENVYVVFGRPDWPATINVGLLDGSNGFRCDGGVGSDDFGRFVSFTDLDSDGFDDLVVSSPRANGLAGEVNVVYGGATGPLSPFLDPRPHVVGTAGNDKLKGAAVGETFDGLGGDDIMNGGSGGGDQYRGGAGIDMVTYAKAKQGITLSLNPGSAGVGAAAGDTFLSIEKIVGTQFKDTIRGDHGDDIL